MFWHFFQATKRQGGLEPEFRANSESVLKSCNRPVVQNLLHRILRALLALIARSEWREDSDRHEAPVLYLRVGNPRRCDREGHCQVQHEGVFARTLEPVHRGAPTIHD